MWELSQPWFTFVIRASTVFIGLFIMFRFFGSKHLAEMAPFDLLLLLIMSEAVQNSLVGTDASITAALLVVGTFMVLATIMNLLSYRFRKVEKILEGHPVLLIRNGVLLEKSIKKQRITTQEIHEAIREQGLQRIEDVGIAMLETNGKISVIRKKDYAGWAPTHRMKNWLRPKLNRRTL